MSFERTPLPGVPLEDLDRSALSAFIASRSAAFFDADASEDQRAQRLGLLGKAATRLAPTPVGLLLFGHNPQLLFPQWGLSAVAIDGHTLGDPVAARMDAEGSVPKLLAAALAFVADHTRTVTDEIAPMGRHPEHAEVAVQEALVNALIHRDLRKPGRVAVRVFRDRLEIWNPGGIGDGVTDLEDAVQHGGVSMPRNPLLAANARLMGMGEQIGRGLVLIRRAISDSGMDRLHLRATPRDFLVVLPSRLSPPMAARPLT